MRETPMRRREDQSGFTLIEVMIAAVVVVILALGLASSMGAAFMADAAARNAAVSTQAAQQVMEELQGLAWADVLACDGDAVVTGEGCAVKVAVNEAMVGMLLVEVYACHPVETRAAAELAGMGMTQVKSLGALDGSQVRLLTYRSGS